MAAQQRCVAFACAVCVLLCTSQAARAEKKMLKKGINDYAGVVDAETERSLDAYLLELEQKTGAQLRVLTINSTHGADLYQYTMDIAQREAMGQSGENNGVVVAIAVNDRRWRIVTGEGVEDTLPDTLCDQIAQRFFVPNFRRNDYSAGIHAGVIAMAQRLAQDKGVTLSGAPPIVHRHSTGRRRSTGGFSCFWFILIFVLMSGGAAGGFRRRRAYGAWGGGGLVQGLLLGSLFSNMTRGGGGWSSGGSSWGGGGFGGGGFGGFGGGGGGSFGGGGAGGSW